MFTSLQTAHLERIMKDRPRNIKDLALLTLASQYGHPKLMEWYTTPKTPVALTLVPFLHQKPSFKLCVTHIKECYYIGTWQCHGHVQSFTVLLEEVENREELCKQCLRQICSILCHLKEKEIYYVHGNLNLSAIVIEKGKFYIVDRGFPKHKHVTDPYFCYRSPTHDLYTLCSAMRQYFSSESYFYTFLSGDPGDEKFLPEIFKDRINDSVISMYLKGR